VFGDVELGHGHQAPWGPQTVVITQGSEVQLTAAELTAQVPLHTGQIVRPGSDMEGVDHHLGRLIRRQGRQEFSPQLPPVLAGEDVVLQLGAQQGSGFAAQAVDHMAEIDPPQWPAGSRLPMQARQGFHELTAQEQIQPVMAQVHRQLLADQPGWDAVGDGAHLNRAGAPHPRHHWLVVGKTLHRQRLQVQPLDLEPAGHLVAAVEGVGDVAHQLAVLRLSLEIPAAALDQLLLQPVFPVPVRPLDRAVLVGHAAVVAGGDHAQMGAELAVATGVVTGVAAVTVAEAGAEAVGAVLRRYPAAEGQGVLQRF
jgi:hypothetical protein